MLIPRREPHFCIFSRMASKAKKLFPFHLSLSGWNSFCPGCDGRGCWYRELWSGTLSFSPAFQHALMDRCMPLMIAPRSILFQGGTIESQVMKWRTYIYGGNPVIQSSSSLWMNDMVKSNLLTNQEGSMTFRPAFQHALMHRRGRWTLCFLWYVLDTFDCWKILSKLDFFVHDRCYSLPSTYSDLLPV